MQIRLMKFTQIQFSFAGVLKNAFLIHLTLKGGTCELVLVNEI